MEGKSIETKNASKPSTSLIRSMLKSLLIAFLCVGLIVFQIFFPYLYYSSTSSSPSQTFTVGVHYAYDQDSIAQIYNEISKIHTIGFKIIRVYIQCDPTDPGAYINQQTDEFFLAVNQFNISVALGILNHETPDRLQYYLSRWGKNLTYIQILNEPELSQSWDAGSLFTDDEIFSSFQQTYNIIEQYHLFAQLYTNFEPGFILRSSVPITLSKNLDFVGLDVYMQSFLQLSPNFAQMLHSITGKEVMITEFGMSTNDDTAQANFILQGLNLFKNMGLKSCWIAYWNAKGSYYGIRGRLAKQKIGDWIAKNA
jgi:hypothetical protein